MPLAKPKAVNFVNALAICGATLPLVLMLVHFFGRHGRLGIGLPKVAETIGWTSWVVLFASALLYLVLGYGERAGRVLLTCALLAVLWLLIPVTG